MVFWLLMLLLLLFLFFFFLFSIQSRVLAEQKAAVVQLKQQLRTAETALLSAQSECQSLADELGSKVCVLFVFSEKKFVAHISSSSSYCCLLLLLFLLQSRSQTENEDLAQQLRQQLRIKDSSILSLQSELTTSHEEASAKVGRLFYLFILFFINNHEMAFPPRNSLDR